MTLNGIDIASYQTSLDLSRVKIDFVISKATGGTGYVNLDCARKIQQAKQLGILTGVYHYAGEGNRRNDPTAEADHFVDNITGYIGESVLALDFEAGALVNWSGAVGWAKAWLDRVHERTGVKPVIYINAYVEARFGWHEVVDADYGLWLAQWPSNAHEGFGRTSPPSVQHWPFVAIWQYSGRGRLGGYGADLDLDVFLGDREAWAAYAAKGGKPSIPKPQPKPVAAEPKPEPVKIGTYTVRAGDTLTDIAARYKTSVSAIVSLNHIGNPDLIYPGQRLRIVGAAAKPKPASRATYYTIRAGDTLSSIAGRYHTTVKRLASLNRLANPNLIYAGDRLRVQ